MPLQESDVRYIPTKLIQLNEWNPNKMPVGTYKKLKASIEKLGMLNAIVVRMLEKDKYEVIDGAHRLQAHKDLDMAIILCSVIEASDDDVKSIIFASGIKGKHDSLKSLGLIEGIKARGDDKLLDACNLDKNKLNRLTKYSGINKSKSTKHLKDEINCDTVKPCSDYRPIFMCSFTPEEYARVIKELNKINKDHSLAILLMLDIREFGA